MNYRVEITNKIIKALEEGVTPWQCPFEACALPVNYKTKQQYQGVNTLCLWLTAYLKGYTSNYWLGFAQAKSLNAHIRKGEKATSIAVCFMKKDEASDGEEAITPFFKTERVFNLDQIEGLEIKTENHDIKPSEEIDMILRAVNPTVRYQGERAYFSISDDFINMPQKSKFRDTEGYYSTLVHELIHWTGHKARLDRFEETELETKQEKRAFEELVAEIGASFFCAEFGIRTDVNNTSSYVASWLKELRNDKSYIFKACKLANLAIDYLKSSVANMNAQT